MAYSPYESADEKMADAGFILLWLSDGYPVPFLSLELIEMARRYDYISHHIVDADTGKPVNPDEFEGSSHQVAAFPALASYLLQLNEKGAQFLPSLDEDGKAEARRIFQHCLEVIGS